MKRLKLRTFSAVLVGASSLYFVWLALRQPSKQALTSDDHWDAETSSSSGRLGYVLTLRYTGQIVAGLRAIASQHCWLSSFKLPLAIVEPYVDTPTSTIVHSPKFWAREDTKNASGLQLSEYYRLSEETGINMASWGGFLTSAPRKLIVLGVKNLHHRECLRFTHQSCSRRVAISTSDCEPLPVTRSSVEYLQARGFVVVREVCVDCTGVEASVDLNPQKLVQHVFGSHQPEDVTLLVEGWRYSFDITPHCKKVACPRVSEFLSHVKSPPSFDEDAAHYLEVIDQLQGNTGEEITASIAVMIRVEWFLINHKHQSLEKIRACLNSVQKMTRSLSGDRHTRMVLALDVGRFGSGSFATTLRLNHLTTGYFEEVQKVVKDFVQELYNGQLSFESWEDSYQTVAGRGSVDRTRVASLQGEVASRAKCLVLMGGGHFQSLALHKYQSRTQGNNCVYKICEKG